VYAISRDRIREVPPLLIIDRAVQEGYKERRPKLITRKNDRVLTLRLPSDVVDAIRWHIGEGYAGPEFLFSQDGTWPQKVNDHEGPLRDVQKALGLKVLSHHKIGRHSVASQAATGGQPIKTIQAQLGHRSSRGSARPPDVPRFTRPQAMSHASRGNHKPNARSSAVPGAGFEPACVSTSDFKSPAYAIPPPRRWREHRLNV